MATPRLLRLFIDPPADYIEVAQRLRAYVRRGEIQRVVGQVFERRTPLSGNAHRDLIHYWELRAWGRVSEFVIRCSKEPGVPCCITIDPPSKNYPQPVYERHRARGFAQSLSAAIARSNSHL